MPDGADSLANQFFSVLGADVAVTELDVVEVAIQAAYDAGRRAAPDAVLEPLLFASHLGRAVAAMHPFERYADAIGALRVSDLYLACACGTGDARAIAQFERTLLAKVGGCVRLLDPAPDFVDKVRQQLRMRLFVATANDAGPKILDYLGRGSLEGWLRVTATRLALNLKRSRKRAPDGPAREPIADLDRCVDMAAPRGGDPEIQMLRAQHRELFRDAFRVTLLDLSPEERAVLRMHYLDGLTIDEICTGYRVHRSTVARWIERARQRVLQETMRRMKTRDNASDSSICGAGSLLQSDFEVSAERLLSTKAD